ncbi:MAG TPA: PH domain-containing protein [Jatrophihabitans sp.]|nr:PH domain-containing protein [Jatrophihabitans sp.]
MTELRRTVLKQPASAYLIVAFVALCVTAAVHSPWALLVYLVPLAGALYVGRTATIIDEGGLRARALVGSERVAWAELRGLRLAESGAVYAVSLDGTQVRLPCVRSTRLDPLIRAAGGRIPELG